MYSSVIITEVINESEEIISTNHNFITIPLGSNCQPADFMRAFNIRFFAAPFDWCITPFESVYKAIKSDFKNFLKKENLTPFFWGGDNPTPNGILDKESGIFYNHDFPNYTFDSINQFYKSVYSKHYRRIKRFYDQINTGKHVYFIRYLDTTKPQACALLEVLKQKFPNTSFTLIVIGNNEEEFDQDWEIQHIKNFYIYCEHVEGVNYTGLENNPFWKKLCSDIRSGALLP